MTRGTLIPCVSASATVLVLARLSVYARWASVFVGPPHVLAEQQPGEARAGRRTLAAARLSVALVLRAYHERRMALLLAIALLLPIRYRRRYGHVGAILHLDLRRAMRL